MANKSVDTMTMYRVYGAKTDGNYHDDYVAAYTAQDAADRIRSEYEDGYEVLEVSKVVRNWR